MADENKTADRKPLFRSFYGPIVPGSFVETDRSVEVRVQQGTHVGVARAHKNAKSYSDEVREALKAAANSSEPTLLRGQLLGSAARGNVHLAINSVNAPRVIQGKVSNVRHSDPSKQPFVSGFIVHEFESNGKTHKFGVPFRAFGDAAVSLAGLQAGDIVNGGVREVVQKREKDGVTNFQDIFEFVGPASVNGKEISMAAERPTTIPPVSQDKPAADQPDAPGTDPFPPSDWDDEIPF